ncbi:MAG TPA: hypothetical protein VHO50_08085 [Bacteroidales bacterium]|nr:hypothetical protein [Bacteroidales bacterium]
MMPGEKKSLADTYAKVVSFVFHPLLMPLYAMAIIISPLTPMGFLPDRVKQLLLLVMFINNVILPLSMLPLLMQLKFISSWTLEEREERALPLLIISILYATSSYIFYRFPVPHFLKSFIFATFLISLILTFINFRWKISLHSTGAGSLISVLLILSFRMYFPLFIFIVISSVVCGMVLSARLQLKSHSPGQVWGGFFTGFSVMSLLFIFLQQLV